MKPKIAISIGDPAGIGPEVTLKALADVQLRQQSDWILVGDATVLELTARELGLPSPGLLGISVEDTGTLPHLARIDFGQLKPDYGAAAVRYITRAVELCLNGLADAMTTAPVNKEAIVRSGVPFTGHTEFIASLCGVADTRMLLAGPRLRVVHVSTHVPLRLACKLAIPQVLHTIELAAEALDLFGRPQGRIAVCGLNPHAGEEGLFGHEELEVIRPAVEQARKQGLPCEGPFPADTVFLKAARGHYDIVVAMYHDQGHIPAKLLDFENTVNVTLGLPIIRTSVDHGTAFDIAGRNLANPTNMKAALEMAIQLATSRKRKQGK